MRFFRLTAAAALAAALLVAGGCSSVHTTRSFNGLALSGGKQNVCHVNGKISGLYCFNIPLMTGDPERPGSLIPLFFRDSVSLDGVADMVSGEAKARGARELLDVTSDSSSIWLMPTWIFWWNVQTMSGNGVR